MQVAYAGEVKTEMAFAFPLNLTFSLREKGYEWSELVLNRWQTRVGPPGQHIRFREFADRVALL